MGAADFVPKNGIFGINGITMVFCDCSSAALNGCLADGRPRVWPLLKDKNDRNKQKHRVIPLIPDKISKTHCNSINSKNSIL